MHRAVGVFRSVRARAFEQRDCHGFDAEHRGGDNDRCGLAQEPGHGDRAGRSAHSVHKIQCTCAGMAFPLRGARYLRKT
jgi:hypothetical protein